MEQRLPKYSINQKVKAAYDLNNDGSYPGRAPEELLIKAGMSGIVVQTGYHEGENIPVYMVDFENKLVVGCFEEDILPEKE